ncbi:hypothetical protein Bca52824_039892 [Brassica carinata]|uniref:CWF21 domain-containing protein n=1 Tax=Brassica carinata TaxID=52824 RepID=A0A8X7RTV3_BRACI|nr:hypothetical protein Bca52824_039892 [Brassica carinata]
MVRARKARSKKQQGGDNDDMDEVKLHTKTKMMKGTAGLSKKPNKDILEHDCKRQIHLNLVVLEDELSDAEIAQRLEEARLNFEASAAEESDAKISDTQTHHKEREADGSFPSCAWFA